MICTTYDVKRMYFCLLLNSCVILLLSETHLNFWLSNNKLCKTTKHVPMCWWELKNFKLEKTLTITSGFRAWCNNKLKTWKYWHFLKHHAIFQTTISDKILYGYGIAPYSSFIITNLFSLNVKKSIIYEIILSKDKILPANEESFSS